MAMNSFPLPKPSEPAPWYYIPDRQAVTVEHPCVVKNIEKAIETLGGDEAINTFVQPGHAGKPIKLKFHPEDAFSQPLHSLNRQTNNVLLKVTVPKRTGRKRKRGSDQPFVDSAHKARANEENKKDAQYLLRSMRDNQKSYQVEAVAHMPTTHVFRRMPDFAYSTTQSQFLGQIREKILPSEYPLLSGFRLDPTRGLKNTEVIPPPVLSNVAYPVNYAYRQNPAVKAYLDPITGARRLYNTQAPTRICTQQCHWDTPSSKIPRTVSAKAPPLESEGQNFQGLVVILRTIFARRPIWTRRALANQLPPEAPMFLAKRAVAYVAYVMRSGPWRDTYIRFGVDPRSDPSYRKYQSLMLQLVSSKKTSAENNRYEGLDLLYWRQDPDRDSHIFTGQGHVPRDGKSWQLCDLEDPLLKKLVDIPDLHIRERCESRFFGWYQNGTWCKLKVILKTKVDLMLDGFTPDEGFDLRFDRFLALPETYTLPVSIPTDTTNTTNTTNTTTTTAVGGRDLQHQQLQRDTSSPSTYNRSSRYHERTLWEAAGKEGDPLLGFLPRNASKMELEWAAQYRALCRAPEGQLPPSGRLTKSRLAARQSFIAGDVDDDDDGEGEGEGEGDGGDDGVAGDEGRPGSAPIPLPGRDNVTWSPGVAEEGKHQQTPNVMSCSNGGIESLDSDDGGGDGGDVGDEQGESVELISEDEKDEDDEAAPAAADGEGAEEQDD